MMRELGHFGSVRIARVDAGTTGEYNDEISMYEKEAPGSRIVGLVESALPIYADAIKRGILHVRYNPEVKMLTRLLSCDPPEFNYYYFEDDYTRT